MEAAETLFEPVVVRNNVEGREKEILERFGEPTWNNPVVRFLDGQGKDVIPRKDRVWATGALLGRMTAALEAAERDVPPWLDLARAELGRGDVDTAVFAMT